MSRPLTMLKADRAIYDQLKDAAFREGIIWSFSMINRGAWECQATEGGPIVAIYAEQVPAWIRKQRRIAKRAVKQAA